MVVNGCLIECNLTVEQVRAHCFPLSVIRKKSIFLLCECSVFFEFCGWSVLAAVRAKLLDHPPPTRKGIDFIE